MSNIELFTNSIGVEFVLIPPGTFLMGSPQDETGRNGDELQHQVTISKGFWMSRTTVTQGQWNRLHQTPWHGASLAQKGEQCSATWVSWEESMEFCQLLSEQEGRVYRLPTEAEWEYACRGGTTTRFSSGDCEIDLEKYAWLSCNHHIETKYQRYGCVRQKLANPFRLFDMHGHVVEWCLDGYREYTTEPQVDPRGPDSPDVGKVIRGGSTRTGPECARSAWRGRLGQRARYTNLGFRLVLECGT